MIRPIRSSRRRPGSRLYGARAGLYGFRSNAAPARFSIWIPAFAGMSGNRAGRARDGFTLIELLVALAVFSLAALALLNLGGENTRSAARAETRTLGGIVAENLAVEAMTAQPAPAPGDSDGVQPFAGRDWRWTRAVTATDDPDILRIDIRVSDDEGQAAERVLFRAVGS